MPTICTGNMWNAYPCADIFCITTNSFITYDGRLVMGRGIAREARNRFPDLDRRLATLINRHSGSLGQYSIVTDAQTKITAFQVKRDWRDRAQLTLINASANALLRLLQNHPQGATLNVHLNFPGIGNGRLTRAVVEPYLAQLPANVYIWQLEGA